MTSFNCCSQIVMLSRCVKFVSATHNLRAVPRCLVSVSTRSNNCIAHCFVCGGALQRVVSRKTESVTKFAGMVHEIGNKANEAFLNLSVDPIKLPQKKAVTQKDLPGPLYVLFSQFSNIKAVYEDQVQVLLS